MINVIKHIPRNALKFDPPTTLFIDFHWVLVVVVLKERFIRVYASSIGSRKRVHYEEINQLSIMFPNYLHDSGSFDKMERINWLLLEVYKDKVMGELLGPQHSFAVEYA